MKGEDEPTNPKYISISSFPFDIKICTSKAKYKNFRSRRWGSSLPGGREGGRGQKFVLPKFLLFFPRGPCNFFFFFSNIFEKNLKKTKNRPPGGHGEGGHRHFFY